MPPARPSCIPRSRVVRTSDGVILLEIDAAGSAYALLGDAVGTAFVSSGGLAHGGNADDYFVKLNAAGNTFLDASYFGGSDDDFSLAMAVDAQQNLYLGGRPPPPTCR